MKERLEGLARAAVRWPALTVALAVALALGGGLLALGLKPSAGTDTFVSSSSASYRATAEDHAHFGSDPVVILIREPLPELVETKDLATVTQLEACLAGQVVQPKRVTLMGQKVGWFEPAAAGSQPPYGGWASPCGALMRERPAQVVYGPGTFLNRAVAAVDEQVVALIQTMQRSIAGDESAAYESALARHKTKAQALAAARGAGSRASQQATTQLEQLYLDSGISGIPTIDDPQFIPQIVFDQTRGVNEPKARFAYLFPTPKSALIQVRLRANLTDAQQARAIALIRQAVGMPMFRSAYGGTYLVSGAPVVTGDLATQITGSIAALLVAAVLVMAATLLIVFRRRRAGPTDARRPGWLRLLPLAVALAAAGITFGMMAVVGATLTMASIAVLPILIGLAVDYAVQFQSRVEEAGGRGTEAGGRGAEAGALGGDAEDAVARGAGLGAPTIAVAALATATGFLVLLLSPVPMVRGFGLLLVVGIAIAFVCTLTAGSAVLVLSERAGGRFGAAWRGAGEIVADAGAALARVEARVRGASARVRPVSTDGAPPRGARALRAIATRPATVLLVAAGLALVGWVADTQTAVQSDVTKLVPSSMPALRDLNTLEKVTGVSGEIDVTVTARNVATPSIVGWMVRYEQTLLTHFGYVEAKGCARATLCPALSLPDLFAGSSGAQPAALTQDAISTLLSAVPSYFSRAVISPDHREAALAFGIRLMPLARQQQVVDYMRSRLHPPAGVSARLAGLPILAAEANTALSSSTRRLLTLLAGLLAVGLVMLVVFRSAERALVPLVPIVLATGWSALILYATRIPLNPMSATLGALVIAISTEFSVLLSERFRQERAAGHPPADALARTYRSTGAAVLASGITAIAGFGVLVLSDITMLRDFGLVTLIDLSVSLGGVLLVLPAVLALAEQRESVVAIRGRLPSLRLRRRRARVA